MWLQFVHALQRCFILQFGSFCTGTSYMVQQAWRQQRMNQTSGRLWYSRPETTIEVSLLCSILTALKSSKSLNSLSAVLAIFMASHLPRDTESNLWGTTHTHIQGILSNSARLANNNKSHISNPLSLSLHQAIYNDWHEVTSPSWRQCAMWLVSFTTLHHS